MCSLQTGNRQRQREKKISMERKGAGLPSTSVSNPSKKQKGKHLARTWAEIAEMGKLRIQQKHKGLQKAHFAPHPPSPRAQREPQHICFQLPVPESQTQERKGEISSWLHSLRSVGAAYAGMEGGVWKPRATAVPCSWSWQAVPRTFQGARNCSFTGLVAETVRAAKEDHSHLINTATHVNH